MTIAQKELRRDTLAEQIARLLVAYIDDQSLEAGDVLPSESRLADEFKVSRATVREAIRLLEAQGLVETANGKRSRVRPVSSELLLTFFSHAVRVREESLFELMELRTGIEVQSATLAAKRRTGEELGRMTGLVSAMHEALLNPVLYTKLDSELHMVIASASHNDMISKFIAAVRKPIEQSIQEGLHSRTSDSQWNEVQFLHAEIVQQIAERDAERAGQAMERHFKDAVNAITNWRAPNSSSTSHWTERHLVDLREEMKGREPGRAIDRSDFGEDDGNRT